MQSPLLPYPWMRPWEQKVRAVVGDLGKTAPPAARSLWRWTRASGGAAHPHRAWLLLLLATAAYAVVALPHIFAARLPEFNDHELPNTRSVGRGRGSSKGASLPGRRGGRHATPATRTRYHHFLYCAIGETCPMKALLFSL